jgi:hypothetical protein
MTISDNAKLVARELVRVWGRKPQVFRHWDDPEQHFIDVASIENSPVDGITAVSTVGLSDHDVGLSDLRIELIGAFPTSFVENANIAATCAFNAFKDNMTTRPDAIHPNVISLYQSSSSVPHVLMVDPFLWEGGPLTLELPAFSIAWLMMVPISDTERSFADEHGANALTTLFEREQIDIFDLNRTSIA